MRPNGFLLAATSILVASTLLVPLTARADEPKCGAPGRPACPLQHWMRTRLAAALANKDQSELARRLDEVATINPDPRKWANWAKMARDGASAARQGKARGVTASCARCHSVYRSEFLIRFRIRRLP